MLVFSFTRKPQRLRISLALLVLLAFGAAAQTPNTPPSLRQALDAAWQLSGPSRAEGSRRSELSAKGIAASSWLSGEPALAVAHRTDRLHKNEGYRDYEAEVELPLWNPGVRAAAQADVSAQRQGFDSQLALGKLKLAGELRALSASAAAAQVELDVNQRKLLDAQALAQDLSRRVKAGENARVDVLQAQALVQQAQAAIAQAQNQLLRLQSQWRGLTGLATVATQDELPLNLAGPEALAAPVSPDHPALRQARAQLGSAQSKLALTDADRRDSMSVGIGIGRERSVFGAVGETKLRIALRIPLGGDNRNAPRQAAARAELDTAQADADGVARQLAAEAAAADDELRAARVAQAAARERLRLSTEVQVLITRSWQLGESDLPTRLRADNEQFEARLSLAKASVDVQRAIANLNQAYGYLP